jgi:pyridoxal phosphate enzyme (YggS family)
MAGIKEKVDEVRGRIAQAARRAGRKPEDVLLVAVTKAATVAKIQEAIAAGVTAFGENRIQDAAEKIPQLPADLDWHLIGHLQTNKAKTAVGLFRTVQSVDSVRLADKLNAETVAAGREVLPVFLEVNVSGEAQKYGFSTAELYSAVDRIAGFERLRIEGLMGIAPNDPDPDKRRQAFRELRQLFGVVKSIKHERVRMRHLSMGMSDDFETAVEEGSTLVRIGRAIFA